MLLLRAHGSDPNQTAVERKVDLVSPILAEYRDGSGAEHPANRTDDDLDDEATGLPR